MGEECHIPKPLISVEATVYLTNVCSSYDMTSKVTWGNFTNGVTP